MALVSVTARRCNGGIQLMTRSNVSRDVISGRRWLTSAFAVAATLVWWSTAAPAKAEPGFPNRTIRISVPYGPGGVGDLTMRLVAQKLTERMGKQVIIENRPGAGGVLAAKAVLDSPPDGYSLLVTGNGTAISMSLFKVRPYNALTDFTQISVTASFEMLIATPAEFAVQDGFGHRQGRARQSRASSISARSIPAAPRICRRICSSSSPESTPRSSPIGLRRI